MSVAGDNAALGEARRVEALQDLGILDTGAESVFDRFTKIAAHLFKTEMALISFVDSGRQWVKSRFGVDLQESKRTDAICNVTITSDDVLIVPDCTLDPRFADGALVRDKPGLRFYAGAPLITADGHRIGALCVLDTRPRRAFSVRDAQTLRELARSVMVQLELRRQMAALTFQHQLNDAIAATADFQSALNVALTYLGKHVGAGFCLVSQACAEPGFMRFVSGVAIDPQFEPIVAHELMLDKIDLAFVSRGQALLEQRPKCDESMKLADIPKRFAGRRRFVAAGIQSSLSVPFNIGTLASAVLVCFTQPLIGQSTRDFIAGFVAQLCPLLRGRLREEELEQERILISQANRAMRTLLAANHAITHAKTEAALIDAFCRVAVEEGGYTTALVGFAEQDSRRSIRYLPAAGPNARFMALLKTSWADTPDGQGPGGIAIRENRIVVIRDMQNNPLIDRWRDITQRTQHDACIAIPLHRGDGAVIGVLLICHVDKGAAKDRGMHSFNAEEAELLKELGANLAYGIAAIREQAAHHAARQLQAESEQRLSHLLAASPTVLYALEHDGRCWRVVEITQNIERILGVTAATAMRPGWWDRRIHAEDKAEARAAHLRVRNGERAVVHYRVARKAGGYCWIRDESVLIPALGGQPARILGAWLDITEKQEAEAEIHRLAFFDPLTGLPNRRLLFDRLKDALAQTQQSGQSGAVMMLDLDGFKAINDVHGHAAGDKVLAAVGERLLRGLRASDTVARLGGDEFVVLLPRLGERQELAAARARGLAEDLAREIEQPISIDSRQVSVAGSIGISLFPGDGMAADEIMKAADTAMYAAKAATSDRALSGDSSKIAIFQPSMLTVVTQHHQIQAEIRAALAQDQFELWLQRQVDGNGKIIGAEALIRLRTVDGRSVPPLEFIPVAETCGLIAPIGQWIISEAFRLLGSMDEFRLPRLSINISAIEFRQHRFVETLLERLRQSGLDAARLTIEITESLLIERLDETILKLQKLRDHGLRISIDDFGTGYSSLAYLQRLPISEIKIDRRFVSQMLTDPRSAEVTVTLLAVARNLGLEVVAEGVETAEQAAFLRHHGCQSMQGFLFGWPEPAARFALGEEIVDHKMVAF